VVSLQCPSPPRMASAAVLVEINANACRESAAEK
jgi:hypothetical protein